MNYIDLFAGAGGLSEGFMEAGFTPLAHVEMNSDACQTIRTRLSYHYLKEKRREYLYFQYLRKEISRDELYAHIPEDILKTVINQEISEKTINRIFNTIDGLCGGKKVDVIIGGPPCQAYSMAGRAKQKKLQEEQKTDKKSFEFNLQSNGRLSRPMKFEIKDLREGGIILCETIYGVLIDLGDIHLRQKNWKYQSYCYQNENRFDYHGIENALCGKTNPTNFTPKRILVMQMK